MIHGSIPSNKINSNSIRAKDHLIHPKDRANKLVDEWLTDHCLKGLIKPKGLAMNSLVSRIEAELKKSYEAGQCSVFTEVEEEDWTDPEPMI